MWTLYLLDLSDFLSIWIYRLIYNEYLFSHVTETSVEHQNSFRTSHSVDPLCVEEQANRTGSAQEQQRRNRVNHLSLLVQSLTSHAGRSFGFSQHIAPVAWLSLQITPLYSKSTSRKRKMLLHTHPLPWKKKSYHHSLSSTHNKDGETSAAQRERETLFWRACLFSALRFFYK